MGPSGEELTPGEQSLRVEKFSSLTAMAVVETGATRATNITNSGEESVEAAMMVQGMRTGGGNMVDFDEVDETYPHGGSLAVGSCERVPMWSIDMFTDEEFRVLVAAASKGAGRSSEDVQATVELLMDPIFASSNGARHAYCGRWPFPHLCRRVCESRCWGIGADITRERDGSNAASYRKLSIGGIDLGGLDSRRSCSHNRPYLGAHGSGSEFSNSCSSATGTCNTRVNSTSTTGNTGTGTGTGTDTGSGSGISTSNSSAVGGSREASMARGGMAEHCFVAGSTA